MKKVMFIVLLLSALSSRSYGLEFSSIKFKNWSKEVITSEQIRFVSHENKKSTMHLQRDSYDPLNHWNEKTLANDIKTMLDRRKSMSSFFGIKNYQLENYSFQTLKANPSSRLDLSGSFERFDGVIVYFNEINFYYKKHFLQIKLMSDKKNKKEILDNIIAQIELAKLELE